MYGNAFFFFAMILFLFVAWVATGGPDRPISTAGPFITPVTNVGQEQQGYGNWWDIVPGESNWWTGGGGSKSSSGSAQSTLWKTQDDLEDLQKDLQAARLFGTPSPYRGKVSIVKNTTALAKTDTDEEYVVLTASGSAKENISITGWKLVSTRSGTWGRLPTGTTLFKFGSVNNSGAIILQPGERAVVTTGRSPVGTSFRENSCVGYLGERQDFMPSLSLSCPAPLDDFDRFYNGAAADYQKCRSAVSALPRCETPSSRANGTSSECFAFMRAHYTYNACTTFHANDRTFWGRTWRVYLGRSQGDLWEAKNDTIKLLDSDGLTVDAFSY